MEYVGWLFGSAPAAPPRPARDLRRDSPNFLVYESCDELRECPGEPSNRYEYAPRVEGGPSSLFLADLPFDVAGRVAAYGMVLPYFELTVELATRHTDLWAGFPGVGGAELVTGSGAGTSRRHLSSDTHAEFGVGDVLGVGINPRTRRLYFCRNGQVVKAEAVAVPEGVKQQKPAVRLRGAPCKFLINLGDTPFAFAPFSYTAPSGQEQREEETKP